MTTKGYKIISQVIDGRTTYWRYGSLTRVVDSQDKTAEWPYPYSALCVACWLGHGHSFKYHERELAARRPDKGPGRIEEDITSGSRKDE